MGANPNVPTIHLFSMDVRELPDNGKELTFSWNTSGGSEVMLICGNQRRFGKWWMVEPIGTHTVELYGTIVPNPPMFLTVKNEAGQTVEQTIHVPWPCSNRYFFTPEPEICPGGPPCSTQAAEQVFQHGRMIWLQQISPDVSANQQLILVLHDNGKWVRYYDTWEEGQPTNDPDIAPPPGYYRPVRGFGKVWREMSEVRELLGLGHRTRARL